MIYLYPISVGVKRHCTHCDALAEFELMACNPKVVQQSTTACFCGECMARLKQLVSQVHISQHSNGAEPQEEICPVCKGAVYYFPYPNGNISGICPKCNGTGKLRHC